MIRLSVVVPFYNVEAYASDTLRSLRASAADGVEFVLVDDGSTDGTLALIQAGAARLPGATVVTSPVNRGLSAARNLGLAAASGEYLAFLDGDDFVAAGYYPTLLATIERLGCEMVRTDHVQVHGRERTVHRICHGPRNVVGSPRQAILPLHRRTSVDAPYAWAGIFHRSVVDRGLLTFDERLRTCEDRPWNWRLHLGVRTFAVVGLIGVFYRRNVSTSLTQISDERQLDFIVAFDQIVADVQADADADALLPKAIRSYCAMVAHHLDERDRYQPELAHRLGQLCSQALNRLPEQPLREVLGGLDAPRVAQLSALLAAA